MSLIVALIGIGVCAVALLIVDPILTAHCGIRLKYAASCLHEAALVGIVFGAGILANLGPALHVNRMTLADGLSVKL